MATSLTFLGAAGSVTGSRYLLETAGRRLLVDCGMFQERENLGRNWGNFGFEPAGIDAVLLTHGHLDHCGWLPKLVKEGFRGPVFATAATVDLAPIILRDTARIQTEDALAKAKRHAREGRKSPYPPVPLYTVEDAEKAIGLLRPVAGLGREIAVLPGIAATWSENGHILGASWIRIEAEGLRLAFSGDIGRWDRPILNDPEPPSEADYLVMESTYGNREHGGGDAETQMEAVAAEAAKRGGNLLIPSFSVERAQELLYVLAKLREKGRLPYPEVHLDSPMAEKVTDLFRRHPEVCDAEMLELVKSGRSPFAFAGLHYVKTPEESKRLNEVKIGAIIIAGNGMCTGGRIKHHLAHGLERPDTTVLFVGYQATGTLGRQLSEGAEEVRLFNRPVRVRAAMRQLLGLSGHADRNELLRWADGLRTPPRRCFVTHGDPTAAAALAGALAEKYGWRTACPRLGERAELG